MQNNLDSGADLFQSQTWRYVVISVIVLVATCEMAHILYTWHLWATKLHEWNERDSSYLNFFSRWTFFFPSFLGCLLAVIACWYASIDQGKYWKPRLILTLLLSMIYLLYVNQAVYLEYNFSHSGPFG
jgi:hypothetical protein